MEATILIILVAILYSIVGLAFIVLPLFWTDSAGERGPLRRLQAP